jgi:hypothetical protein
MRLARGMGGDSAWLCVYSPISLKFTSSSELSSSTARKLRPGQIRVSPYHCMSVQD